MANDHAVPAAWRRVYFDLRADLADQLALLAKSRGKAKNRLIAELVEQELARSKSRAINRRK